MARKNNSRGVPNMYVPFSPQKATKVKRLLKTELAKKNVGCRYLKSLYKELNEIIALYNNNNTEFKTTT